MQSTRDTGKPHGGDFVQGSSLYRAFLAEREEILRHKWLESEKVGRDIGFERALLDWIRNHRDRWRAAHKDGTDGVDGSGSPAVPSSRLR